MSFGVCLWDHEALFGSVEGDYLEIQDEGLDSQLQEFWNCLPSGGEEALDIVSPQ